MFMKALKRVSIKHKDKYKFILKAGTSLLNAIFDLFTVVWKREEIPDKWCESLLVQLSKGKGYQLDDLRHIH